MELSTAFIDHIETNINILNDITELPFWLFEYLTLDKFNVTAKFEEGTQHYFLIREGMMNSFSWVIKNVFLFCFIYLLII